MYFVQVKVCKQFQIRHKEDFDPIELPDYLKYKVTHSSCGTSLHCMVVLPCLTIQCCRATAPLVAKKMDYMAGNRA